MGDSSRTKIIYTYKKLHRTGKLVSFLSFFYLSICLQESLAEKKKKFLSIQVFVF